MRRCYLATILANLCRFSHVCSKIYSFFELTFLQTCFYPFLSNYSILGKLGTENADMKSLKTKHKDFLKVVQITKSCKTSSASKCMKLFFEHL